MSNRRVMTALQFRGLRAAALWPLQPIPACEACARPTLSAPDQMRVKVTRQKDEQDDDACRCHPRSINGP
jgi:hypothetical protein